MSKGFPAHHAGGPRREKVVNIDFTTVLPDHIQQRGPPSAQQAHLMSMAVDALVREILETDGAFEIFTERDVATQCTRVLHRVRLVVKEK